MTKAMSIRLEQSATPDNVCCVNIVSSYSVLIILMSRYGVLIILVSRYGVLIIIVSRYDVLIILVSRYGVLIIIVSRYGVLIIIVSRYDVLIILVSRYGVFNTKNTLNTKLTGTICDPFLFDVLYSGTLLTSLSTVTPVDVLYCGTLLTSLSTVTPVEVLRIISAMTAKSSPVDSVPTSIIKACPAVFSELIAYLDNHSFAEGCFSDHFKRAQVTPLLKEGLDKILRPITDQYRI